MDLPNIKKGERNTEKQTGKKLLYLKYIKNKVPFLADNKHLDEMDLPNVTKSDDNFLSDTDNSKIEIPYIDPETGKKNKRTK